MTEALPKLRIKKVCPNCKRTINDNKIHYCPICHSTLIEKYIIPKPKR